MFTWVVGQPAYWRTHSMAHDLHSIPPPLVASVYAGMTGPCSRHPTGAKILLYKQIIKG